ncbi:MAG: Hsp33 family molecular chaperone HslO [Fibrobacterales bacterium]
MSETTHRKDTIIRSTAEKAPFRVVVIDFTRTANKIGAIQGAEAWTLSLLAESSIASLMLSSSLKDNGTVSFKAEFSGDISYVMADSTPAGLVRAKIPHEEIDAAGDFELLLSPQTLRVKKYNKEAKLLSEGIVEMTHPEISKSLAAYYLNSEQTKSAVGIATKLKEGTTKELEYAVGFLVEAFPDIDDKTTAILEQVIVNMKPFDDFSTAEGYDIEGLLNELYGPFTPVIHATRDPVFQCFCSKDRSLNSLQALSKNDIADIVTKGEDTEIICDFCRTQYLFTPTEIEEYFKGAK